MRWGIVMSRWLDVLIPPDSSIKHAIEKIDLGALQIALVVNENNQLLGTVTDGDIRRGILRGISIESSVANIMNKNPISVPVHSDKDMIMSLMQLKHLRQIPVINEARQVVGIETLDELISKQNRDNWVVLMAGGLGSRLQPLTNDCPKPMLKVGNKPVIETIIDNFIDYGFRKFYLTVNYKAEMIEEYFGDGSKWGIEIRYLRESKRMGTAGSLSLLREKPDLPIIIMNGDILTKVNFDQLLEFHTEHKSIATMCVREYNYQVPYGIVHLDAHRLYDIQEKPVHHYFMNAGIYVLNPEALELIPDNSYFDMPDLYRKIILNTTNSTAAFPIREYWIDIGRMSDYEKANGEFIEVFG